jgi:hypothetical protein
LTARPAEQWVEGDKARTIADVRPEDLARMEQEMQSMEKDFLLVEESYGRNVLNLVLARSYLTKLIGQARVVRFLAQKQPEMLAEFQRIVESTSLVDRCTSSPMCNRWSSLGPIVSLPILGGLHTIIGVSGWNKYPARAVGFDRCPLLSPA